MVGPCFRRRHRQASQPFRSSPCSLTCCRRLRPPPAGARPQRHPAAAAGRGAERSHGAGGGQPPAVRAPGIIRLEGKELLLKPASFLMWLSGQDGLVGFSRWQQGVWCGSCRRWARRGMRPCHGLGMCTHVRVWDVVAKASPLVLPLPLLCRVKGTQGTIFCLGDAAVTHQVWYVVWGLRGRGARGCMLQRLPALCVAPRERVHACQQRSSQSAAACTRS